MAYEIEDVRASQEIFYYLLEHHEMKGEAEDALYKAYTEREEVQNLVKSQGELAGSTIERYGNVIYLIPKEENNFLGFSKPQLKAVLCKSNAIRVGELQNCISARLKEGAENAGDSEEDGIAFHDILEAYEALRSDEKGSHARTTKEGFLHQILTFLQKQGLIEYIEQDEMIMTTKKLDNFMDWNLLNQNNYQRILRVLGVAEDE